MQVAQHYKSVIPADVLERWLEAKHPQSREEIEQRAALDLTLLEINSGQEPEALYHVKLDIFDLKQERPRASDAWYGLGFVLIMLMTWKVRWQL